MIKINRPEFGDALSEKEKETYNLIFDELETIADLIHNIEGNLNKITTTIKHINTKTDDLSQAMQTSLKEIH